MIRMRAGLRMQAAGATDGASPINVGNIANPTNYVLSGTGFRVTYYIAVAQWIPAREKCLYERHLACPPTLFKAATGFTFREYFDEFNTVAVARCF